MKKHILLLTLLAVIASSCTKESDQGAGFSDATLSSMAGSGDLVMKRSLASSGELWNIKMNDIAANAYASGADYPANSMIVKEKRNAAGLLTGYDIMYKSPADPNSSGGWLYSSIDGHGQVVGGVDTKGTSCRSCHAQSTKSISH